MKKQNKFLSIGVMACVLVIGSAGFFNNNKAIKGENSSAFISSEAKVIGYHDFNELDNTAELILKGTKAKVINTFIDKNEFGETIDYHTQSAIKINQIFKSDNPDIVEGSEVTVQENGAFETTEDGTLIYGIEGYQLMNEDEEYLLFLDKSLTDPNVYFIKGVYYGKIPLSESKVNKILELSEGEFSQDLEIFAEYPESLNGIFKEALEKYGR